MSVVIAEERTKLRIANVVMHLKIIRVVAQVQSAHGEPYSVLWTDINVFRDPSIKGEIVWIAGLQSRLMQHVLLKLVNSLVREAIPVFDMRG